jgi:hypothetical protein
MKILSPSRMIFIVLMMLASIERTVDAQLLQGALDFFSTFDFNAFFASICPTIGPLLESFRFAVEVLMMMGLVMMELLNQPRLQHQQKREK